MAVYSWQFELYQSLECNTIVSSFRNINCQSNWIYLYNAVWDQSVKFCRILPIYIGTGHNISCSLSPWFLHSHIKMPYLSRTNLISFPMNKGPWLSESPDIHQYRLPPCLIKVWLMLYISFSIFLRDKLNVCTYQFCLSNFHIMVNKILYQFILIVMASFFCNFDI